MTNTFRFVQKTMMPYKILIIYYFTGTGNSENVALWLSEVASKYNISTHIKNIADIDRQDFDSPPSDALIVFVSPIHGFNYPPIMLHFIGRFPKSRNNVLLMNTRAGMLIGKYNVPGLTGVAFFLSAAILKLKGYSIKGMVAVDLPSNWISVHPGLNQRTIKYLHEINKKRVTECAEKVFSGKSNFKALREIIQDLIISPISLGYYFIGRFVFAKTFYASSDCNNCDICIKNCPVKAIIKVNKRPFWTFKCESCMNCMSHCPKKAIETAHGFIVGFVFLSSVLTGLFYSFFSLLFFNIENELVKFVVETLLFLTLLGISYRILHYLMRFKPVERLMVYTSLTKYKFWGRRYKALKNF